MRWPGMNESEAGTPKSSAEGRALLGSLLIGRPTYLPRPHVLGFLGEAGEVRVGSYIFADPVYNASGIGRGFAGQVSLGPPTLLEPTILGG